MQSTRSLPDGIVERYCCGQLMEIYPGAMRWGMMDFEHQDMFDLECAVCGKAIFDIPA